MKHLLLAWISLASTVCISAEMEGARTGLRKISTSQITTLHDKQWIHGSADCKSSEDPAIEVFRYDHSSYILRQNKCLSFEAPFLYVLFGDEKVLVLDTGATESDLDFPLYETVRSLIREQSRRATEEELLVIHSHSHSDHHAGDSQFEGKPNVTVVEPNYGAVTEFFSFSEWPDGVANLELGGRKLIIIPTPGHQEEAISVYDPQTKWLLTGDTIYPGYIYVKNWDDYRKSIARLVFLSNTYDISAVLGAHIEMTGEAGEYYPIGTVYQPNEAPLTLTSGNLVSLKLALEKLDQAQKIVFDEFIVEPMSVFQKTLSNIARWLVK